MTNELKNVPELRFSEFDGVWENSKLGTVANVYDGTHQTPKYTIEGIKFLSVENIKTLNSNKFISKEAFEKEFKIRPEFGDVLMTRIGDVGTPNVIETNEDLAYYVSLALLKPKKLNSYFLESLIRSQTVQNELWRKTLHIAFPKKINKNEIAKVEINYPEQMEQQKIGEFFSKLDQQIELEEQKLAKLEEQKKGYIQKLFSQELRFKDENGDDYPEWMETNIRNIFDNKGGTALEKEFDNNGTHKVISIGSYSMNSTYNEQNLRINKNDFTEKYLLNEGDLAMVLNDKTKEGNIIGRTIYIDEDDKYIYNQRTERLIPVTGNNHKFLWYLMNSEQFRKKIKQMMQGATQVYINYNSIKDLSIYLPILEEQNKIENFLGDIFNIIKNQSDKVELLKRRKKGFLQKMFV